MSVENGLKAEDLYLKKYTEPLCLVPLLKLKGYIPHYLLLFCVRACSSGSIWYFV